MRTRTQDIVSRHDPPLGRLNWGEEAYDAQVLLVLEAITGRDEANLLILESYATDCLQRTGEFALASLTRL